MTAGTGALTMRAVQMHAYGGPEMMVLEEVARPEPGQGQVLVRVHAAGVGAWDGEIRRGEWRGMVDYPLPLILGTDMAGVVDRVGPGVGGLAPGEEVYGVADMTLSGSNAEFALARAEALAPRPKSLEPVAASSVPVAAVTAQMMVEDLARVGRGHKVLVIGGAGAVGAFAVQLARRAGAQVVATASENDLKYVRSLGAEDVIDHGKVAFEEVVKGVDVVINTAPDDEVRDRAYASLKPGGILVFSALQPSEELDRRHEVRSAFVESQVTTARLRALTLLLDSGELRPDVGTVLPLGQAPRAHEMLEGAGHPRGKIVLRISE